MDIVSIDAQMMFEHDLDHLSLDPGLFWMFVKNEQTDIVMGGHCIVTIPGQSV